MATREATGRVAQTAVYGWPENARSKGEIRNPNVEIRNKHKIRTSKVPNAVLHFRRSNFEFLSYFRGTRAAGSRTSYFELPAGIGGGVLRQADYVEHGRLGRRGPVFGRLYLLGGRGILGNGHGNGSRSFRGQEIARKLDCTDEFKP